MLWVLYVGLTVVLDAASRIARLARPRRRDDAVRGAGTRVRDDADGRVLDAGELDRGLLAQRAQWIIALFMLLAGMNFVLLYRGFVRRRPRVFVRDEEFRLYAVLVVGASVALLVQLWGYGIAEGEEAVRTAVFQAISIITTTGFATTDFALWPSISSLTLFALMFVGGSAGSTDRLDQGRAPPAASARCSGASSARPSARRSCMPIRLNGAPVDERTLRAIAAFILLYVGFWAVGALGHRDRLGDLRRAARRARHARASPRAHSATAAPASASPGRSARSPRSATSRRSR